MSIYSSMYIRIGNGVCLEEARKQQTEDPIRFKRNLREVDRDISTVTISSTAIVFYDTDNIIIAIYCSMLYPLGRKRTCPVFNLHKFNWLSGDNCPILRLTGSADCLAQICGFLGPQDMFSLMETCKLFNNTMKASNIWMPLLNHIHRKNDGHKLFTDCLPHERCAQYLMYNIDVDTFKQMLLDDDDLCDMFALVHNKKVFRKSIGQDKRQKTSVVVSVLAPGNVFATTRASFAIGVKREDGTIYANVWITAKGNLRWGTTKGYHKNIGCNILDYIETYRSKLLK